jgi:hypothetical protein
MTPVDHERHQGDRHQGGRQRADPEQELPPEYRPTTLGPDRRDGGPRTSAFHGGWLLAFGRRFDRLGARVGYVRGLVLRCGRLLLLPSHLRSLLRRCFLLFALRLGCLLVFTLV